MRAMTACAVFGLSPALLLLAASASAMQRSFSSSFVVRPNPLAPRRFPPSRCDGPRRLHASSSPPPPPARNGEPFRPPPNLRGIFAGSGFDGLSDPRIAGRIVVLTGKVTPPTVLYIGTATYDLPGPRERQTSRFVEAGCRLSSLDLVSRCPQPDELADAVGSADVVAVSGGNTLYAVDRWRRLGLDGALADAAGRGAVLAGGSAGAICWFDGGHSDSMDPASFRGAMAAKAGAKERGSGGGTGDEIGAEPPSKGEAEAWEYIRVDGLGFLPSLVCPHHDRVQSNGKLRATDFEEMMLRHPAELGIGIDHWAALEVAEGRYRVMSLEDKEGSVLRDGGTFSPDRKGVPGVWLKEVRDGRVRATLCPETGGVEELLYTPSDIVEDARMDICRKANPDEGPMPKIA